jgi:hypothetical protein
MSPEQSDFEARLRAARAAFIAKADATFDFDAGLADVRARARASVDERVYELVDRLASMLTLVDRQDSNLAFDHVQRVREILFEFRSRLSDGRYTSNQRAALLAQVGDHLTSADAILRAEGGGSLADAMQARLADLGPVSVDALGEFEALRALVNAPLERGSKSPSRPNGTARGESCAG